MDGAFFSITRQNLQRENSLHAKMEGLISIPELLQYYNCVHLSQIRPSMW